MSELTEEERAALWRLQQRRRVQFQAHLMTLLEGDPDAARAILDAWQSWVAWRKESEFAIDDPEDDVGTGAAISDMVNVGRLRE